MVFFIILLALAKKNDKQENILIIKNVNTMEIYTFPSLRIKLS